MTGLCVSQWLVRGRWAAITMPISGEDVVFLAIGANLQAIREHGLQVDSVDGDIV